MHIYRTIDFSQLHYEEGDRQCQEQAVVGILVLILIWLEVIKNPKEANRISRSKIFLSDLKD